MGECAYFCKLQYDSDNSAKKAAKYFKRLLKEAHEVHELYQSHRTSEEHSVDNQFFWKEVDENYPTVTAYLQSAGLYRKTVNDLSGSLDLGCDQDEDPCANGSVVEYYAQNVWHLSNWTLLINFLKSSTKAIKAVWSTEENGDNLESLQLYQWQDIVKTVLRQKQVLPLLMGLDTELDELIAFNIQKKGKKSNGYDSRD